MGDSHRIHVTVAASKSKYTFLASFAQDLRRIGIRAGVVRNGKRLTFTAVRNVASLLHLRIMRLARMRQLTDNWDFISKVQESGVAREFASGATLQPDCIRPQLQLCATKRDRDLFEFCRLMQNVPSRRLLYRKLAYLVRDMGHANKPLIGILGLSSSVYSLGARDRFLCWTEKDSPQKRRGLNSCMQLAICMAVPPYNYLRAGRLVASLALSDEVGKEFSHRYCCRGKAGPLLGVVTFCAKGIHAPIFNRIKVRQGGLYRRIGCTSGYSALPFSAMTVAAARGLVVEVDGECPDNRSISTLKRALNICGVPRECFLKLGTRKGVYFGAPDEGSLRALRAGQTRYIPNYPTVERAFEVWRGDLTKALQNGDNLRKFRLFDPAKCWAARKRGFWDGAVQERKRKVLGSL